MQFETFPLFDKVINVALMRGLPGQTPTVVNADYIQTPRFGRKPTINITGKMTANTALFDIELRITNLDTGDTPLDAYKYLRISAGYRDSLGTTIEGEVVNAYQETPGPDGITVFHMLQGYFSDWFNVTASNSWPKGTSVNTILNTLCFYLGMRLASTLPDSLETATAWSFTGSVSKFISDISGALGFNCYPNGQFLVAYQFQSDTGVVHDIKYVTTPPRRDAAGYNLVAPWDPTVRPGDVCIIKTEYARQTYGGAQVGRSQVEFICQTVSFDFSTTDDTNSMHLLLTDKPA